MLDKNSEEFRKAKKVKFEEYEGEQMYLDDEYFVEFPEGEKYVWGTTLKYPKVRIDYVFEMLCEDMGLGFGYDYLDFITDANGLEKFLTEWNKKQECPKGEIFYPDFNTIVLAPEDQS